MISQGRLLQPILSRWGWACRSCESHRKHMYICCAVAMKKEIEARRERLFTTSKMRLACQNRDLSLETSAPACTSSEGDSSR